MLLYFKCYISLLECPAIKHLTYVCGIIEPPCHDLNLHKDLHSMAYHNPNEWLSTGCTWALKQAVIRVIVCWVVGGRRRPVWGLIPLARWIFKR